MDVEERELRFLAVEILTLVNRGELSKEGLGRARERLEEAIRELRNGSRSAEATG